LNANSWGAGSSSGPGACLSGGGPCPNARLAKATPLGRNRSVIIPMLSASPYRPTDCVPSLVAGSFVIFLQFVVLAHVNRGRRFLRAKFEPQLANVKAALQATTRCK